MQILIPYEIKQDVNFLQEQWQAHRDSPASVSAVPLGKLCKTPPPPMAHAMMRL